MMSEHTLIINPRLTEGGGCNFRPFTVFSRSLQNAKESDLGRDLSNLSFTSFAVILIKKKKKILGVLCTLQGSRVPGRVSRQSQRVRRVVVAKQYLKSLFREKYSYCDLQSCKPLLVNGIGLC